MNTTKKKIMFLKDYVDIKSTGHPVIVEMATEATLIENEVYLSGGIILRSVPERYYAPLK